MATIDCRIAGEIGPIMVYAGETFSLSVPVLDKNNAPIDLTGFTVGPLTIYSRGAEVAVLEGVTASGTSVVFDDEIPATLKKSMSSGYYCECPLVSPGSGPVAILHFKLLVDGK